MKKDKKKLILWSFYDNYNFYDRHTHIYTYGHGKSMSDPAQRAESVKIQHWKCNSRGEKEDPPVLTANEYLLNKLYILLECIE